MIIGFSGKVGSGKTTLSNMLVDKYNLIKFDCDIIAKELQTKLNFKININEQGFIDESEQNRIIDEFHPLVWNRVEQLIENNKNNNTDIVIETALPSDRFFEIIDISFYIKTELVKERLMLNRKYTESKIETILDSQKFYEKYYEKCDFVIMNNDSKETAFSKIVEIYDSFKGE